MMQLSEGELIALHKALTFIKFKCADDEATSLAKSPLISGIMIKTYELLKPYYIQMGIEVHQEWPYIDSSPKFIETVKKHIENIESWKSHSEETRLEIIKDLIHPYQVGEKVLKSLLQHGNEVHT